jgi:hypothetical protein
MCKWVLSTKLKEMKEMTGVAMDQNKSVGAPQASKQQCRRTTFDDCIPPALSDERSCFSRVTGLHKLCTNTGEVDERLALVQLRPSADLRKI